MTDLLLMTSLESADEQNILWPSCILATQPVVWLQPYTVVVPRNIINIR